jgi:peptidoglycan/LPS O-acetylase OafA/YrhL
MYNNWDEGQFVPGKPAKIPSYFIHMSAPWFMPLLFLLAGISSFYAISSQNNSIGKITEKYIKERILRLLLPFLTGIILYIPLMTYISDKLHNGYSKGFFAHYSVFFTRFTDFSGADGGFTPAHLWFILYLFVISLISLAVIIPQRNFCQKQPLNTNKNRELPLIFLIFSGAIPLLVKDIINIGGKSLTQYLAIFLLGYFVFSRESVIEKLCKYRHLLLVLTAFAGILFGVGIGNFGDVFVDILGGFYGWLFVLSALAVALNYFNSTGKIRLFMRKYSFLIYQIHYPVLVVFAYFLQTKIRSTIEVNLIFLLIFVSYIITLPLAYLLGNIPGLKTLFGQK